MTDKDYIQSFMREHGGNGTPGTKPDSFADGYYTFMKGLSDDEEFKEYENEAPAKDRHLMDNLATKIRDLGDAVQEGDEVESTTSTETKPAGWKDRFTDVPFHVTVTKKHEVIGTHGQHDTDKDIALDLDLDGDGVADCMYVAGNKPEFLDLHWVNQAAADAWLIWTR